MDGFATRFAILLYKLRQLRPPQQRLSSYAHRAGGPKKENIGGRPSYEPTEADRDTVKTMAACGITHDAIARCIGTNGIAPKTLRRHFRHKLDTSLTQVNALVGSQVIAASKRGEAWACCF